MLGFLLFVLGVLVVGGLLFLGASLLLGRGETQPPAELDRSPVELPDDRAVTSDDVRALRISASFRGYRMSEVDWLLDQFALILDERDAEIAGLRQQAEPRPVPHPHPHPHPSPHPSPHPAHPAEDAAPKTLDGPAVPDAEPDQHDEERPHA
jgi:DivIVA domain-containing protein